MGISMIFLIKEIRVKLIFLTYGDCTGTILLYEPSQIHSATAWMIIVVVDSVSVKTTNMTPKTFVAMKTLMHFV